MRRGRGISTAGAALLLAALSGCGDEPETVTETRTVTTEAARSETPTDTETAPRKASRARILDQLVLEPLDEADPTLKGVAVIAQRGDQKQLITQATLPVSDNREAYEVWLYNSRRDAVSLGAQVTDKKGVFQGAGPLPANYRDYDYIDVSRETVDQDRTHSGQSLLRGRLP